MIVPRDTDHPEPPLDFEADDVRVEDGATGLVLAVRTVRRARPESAGPALVALAALLTLMGIWTALGVVAGIPTDAATWLVLGIAALPAAEALDA